MVWLVFGFVDLVWFFLMDIHLTNILNVLLKQRNNAL